MSNVTQDKVNQLLNLKPSTKEYMALRKELSEDEKALLKKLLRKRSDNAYKSKRIANKADTEVDQATDESSKSKVSDNDLDLCKNVKIIKGIIGQMLSIMKKTDKSSSSSSSTVIPNTEDIIESYLGTDEDGNTLSKIQIHTRK
jgi:hypothetical protein